MTRIILVKMVAIKTPHPRLASLSKVPLIGHILILLVVLIPGTVPVALISVPLGVSTEVGTGVACLVSAIWALLLQYRLRTTVTVLFIPIWFILPVLGVLGMLGMLD